MTSFKLWLLGRAASLVVAFLFGLSAARADAGVEPKAEAALRFDRALRLVNDGDLSGALAEFREAHALVPSPVVLYNLGLVYAAMQRPVDAVQWLGDALKAPESLGTEQSAHAQSVRSEQQLRIGYVAMSVEAREGVVEVDNVEVANLPLEAALPVASGAHVVGVIVKGHAPARKEVVVAGSRQVELGFALVPIDGRLAHIELSSSLPGADVFVDGERIGRTPLEASITVVPGKRTVRVARTGYRSEEHALVLGDGARAQLTLNPELDRTALEAEGSELSLLPSEPLSVATVDGVPQGVIAGVLLLPAGPHRVRVERGGFYPAERDLTLPRRGMLRVPVELEPTPSTRASYIQNARRQRRVRGSMLGVSGAVMLGGLVLALVAGHALPEARATQRTVEGDWERGANGACDHSSNLSREEAADCDARLRSANDELARTRALQIAGWSLAGAGALAALASAVLLWRADDPMRYERRAEPAGKGGRLRLTALAGDRTLRVHLTGFF